MGSALLWATGFEGSKNTKNKVTNVIIPAAMNAS